MDTDVIVVGGGHAGIEAAAIAAKAGVSAILVTSNLDLIGQMSCNPAVGGIAKGNMVREVDALGGLMGKLIDRAGIQFRMLNKSKGFAVWGNRAQADKKAYRSWCRRMLEARESLLLYQGTVTGLLVENGRACGVRLGAGETIRARAVVLATGTFLNGMAHIGENSFPCGRSGEAPSLGLSESVQQFGIRAGRLKTGTPARIDGRTVDFSQLKPQKGDEEPWPFSFTSAERPANRAVCWVTRTTKQTHRIVLSNIGRSALYGGKIQGIGPRYCPSIEDKLVKFGERDGHTLFLEPEGLDTQEMYLNGLSTSLPFDVQVAMVHSLPGFDNAEIVRPAYAIEYDYFLPTQLHSTLESRIVENLFFAGQINGTSGYEEAACQGLVAGVNAAGKVKGSLPFTLGRETSYIGVLIDDLVTKGTEEPYRMFTSRAEHRLLLRQDNADERLMPMASVLGLVEHGVLQQRRAVWERKAKLRARVEEARIQLGQLGAGEETQSEPIRRMPAAELLRRPGVHLADVLSADELSCFDREVLMGVEADIKYDGFVRKEWAEVDRQRRMEGARIPDDTDYDRIEGLPCESKAKLKSIRPATLGQASRIAGVTPADISLLIMHIVRNDEEATFHVKP
jgi:tRNA uridine 5-carboxymethylaminomethyl modification enzyme